MDCSVASNRSTAQSTPSASGVGAGTLRAAQRLAARPGSHFAFCPLENPDGYALHQRLIRTNPRHMHHAARYTALGDDLEYRTGAELHEKAIRLEAEARLPALLHLNFHGYPAHEWTRPLSGYVPRGFEVWTIPKGFFLVMRHGEGWDKPARALMIGDSANDALAARGAGMPVLLVSYGYSEGMPVDTIDCDGLLSNALEALDRLQPL